MKKVQMAVFGGQCRWRLVQGVLVVLLGCGYGCAGPGENYIKSDMAETLEIEILPNTSKMFVYRLRAPQGEAPGGAFIARTPNDRRPEQPGVRVNRNTPERLLENAQFVVAKLGYCREGFFEVDRNLSPYNLWLKGECKEGASDADKQKFGSAQTLTAERWR